MSAIEGRRCKHCGWFVSKLELDAAQFKIQCARCGPNGYLEPATLPRHGGKAVKEPGQIAYETFRDLVPAHYPWGEIAPSVKAYWAAVEAACRAEGMREAARIVVETCHDDMTREEEATAILSAIGDSQ